MNLEAMACGTPVITYRTGGSPEAITKETGFVVAQGDLNGVIAAIHAIEQKGKSAYQEACRSRAEICFDKQMQFHQYINLYNSLLK